MNELIESRLTPALLLLAGWSLRWGGAIAALAVWFRLRPPRSVAVRCFLCRLVLLGGLLLPLLPCYWGPTRPAAPADVPATECPPRPLPQPAAEAARRNPPVPEPAAATTPVSPPPGPVTGEEPAAPAVEPAPPRQRTRLALGLASLWAAGVLFFGGRLALAWVSLARLRRASRPAGPEAQALLRQCKAEMGVRRAVELVVVPGLGSPVFLGCGRPCIVVPADWDDLPDATRRVALLHELVHLARRDDWVKLAEGLVRAFFFFHPLVWWLLNRLDGERERLCDAALVRQGVDRRTLARVLFEFVNRLGTPHAVAAGAGLPLFHRLTVKDRIYQLLEDDMTRWIAPLSRRLAAMLGTAVLCLMLGLGSLGVRPASALAEAPPAVPPAANPVPPGAGAPLEGKLVDARGKPLAGARVFGLCRGPSCVAANPTPAVTDKDGRFRLDRVPDGPIVPGKTVSLEAVTARGHSYEVHIVAAAAVTEVRLPTVTDPKVKAPRDVKVGELAGVVVDGAGKPLEGVEVDVWDWYPGNETRTGKDGVFRLKDLGRDSRVQVRFRKKGYSPVMFVRQPTGVSGWVVALDSKTYFEGVVRGPDGKPAAGALIRADQGPKTADGCVITTVWTETKADKAGKYRLYVQPDEYEFLVKASGVGVARLPKTGIEPGRGRALDVKLQAGVTFRARVVDSETDKPVKGVRLWHWQHKDAEGRTDDKGEVAITEMLPGPFEFSVKADGCARCWSEDSPSEWSRRRIDNPALGWQRNFDEILFELKPGMAKVKIVVEKGVRVRGKVLDPDGKPVAGATVAPALTTTGNSLTGDTRFSAATKAEGTFEVLLPASGKARYNLVAHDGKYGEWRKWANGVLPPVRTTAGQQINGVTLTLTRPSTVRGKVVDAQGWPVAFREVRAHAADKLENRYYDPTTTTREDGTFELRCIRPGEQFIQAAPFWLRAEDGPAGATRKLHLVAGQTVEGVQLTAEKKPR